MTYVYLLEAINDMLSSSLTSQHSSVHMGKFT